VIGAFVPGSMMSPAPAPTPEGLALLARDPTASREQRDAAAVALAALVREVAGQCAGAMRAERQLRQDLIDGSWGHVSERLSSYDPNVGPLGPWLRTVLTRLGHSLRRDRQREARHLMSLASRNEGKPDAQEAAGRLEARFAQMRADLDGCAWPPSRAVDYYAVLLVCLRLEIAAVCRRLWPVSPPGDVADRAAGALPWRPAEEARSFRSGLPSLAELWRRLAPRLDRVAGLQVVLEALNDPSPEPPVSYVALAQWESRARRMAEERLGPAAWREHGFAQLLCPSPREGP
jgi:hypothetical protein